MAITKDEAKILVLETLISLGMDIEEPVELQKDMAYLRALRTGSEELKKKGVLLLFTTFIVALVGWAILGFKVTLGQ